MAAVDACDAVGQLRRTARWVGGLSLARLASGTPSLAEQCEGLVLATVSVTQDLCVAHETRLADLGLADCGPAMPCPPAGAVPASAGEWALADQLQVVAADLAEVLTLVADDGAVRDGLVPTSLVHDTLAQDSAVHDGLCDIARSCVALRRA